MTTEQNMLDALIQHQVYSYRASTAVVNELNGLFTKAMNQTATKLRELIDELTDAERDALLSGRYTTDTLKEIKSTFDELYTAVAITVPETFTVSAIALATYEAAYISKLYGEEIELNGRKVVSGIKKKPVMGGMLFDDVWKNLAESTRNKALYAVRQGIEQGNTTAQIVAELRGKRTRMPNGSYEYVGGIVDEVRRNGIEANVRTIRATVANTAMQETFGVLGFDYVKYVSVLDGRTTTGCASLDQTVWKKDDPNIVYPPRHYNCRAILIGVGKLPRCLIPELSFSWALNLPFLTLPTPIGRSPRDFFLVLREEFISLGIKIHLSGWYSLLPFSSRSLSSSKPA